MRILILALAVLAPDDGLAPWAANRLASDLPKKHEETVTAATHAYTLTQGGTMDGRNCRSPLGCGMSREGAVEQTWESNRSVRLENAGEADVVDPWLSNGRNFRTPEEIVASAVAPGMSDAEKAKALWFQRVQNRYHFTGGDNREEGDLIKTFHVYGYNTCGSDSMLLAGAWRQAGLKAAPARGVGHCISQAFYDGQWHLFDGDMQAVYLNRDNETVAGEQDIVRDHDLIKRSHTQGILLPDTRGTQESAAAIYGYEGEVKGQRDCSREGTLRMTLRPGEALVWRWGHLTPARYHGPPQSLLYPNTICNGLWEYRPDFAGETWRKGAVVESVTSTPAGLVPEAGKTGTITWTLRAPYVMVGGRLAATGSGAEFSLSWDGKTWEKVGGNFDKFFAFTGAAPARYGYQLRCTLTGTLKTLEIVNDLQMSPFTLPGMGVGLNPFTYTDASPSRKVRITHEWVERSPSKPPGASTAPVYPPDKGDADGTDLVFKWAAAADPDGDKIADYHFELSNRADLRWPLSMSFYRLISRTPDAGKAQFTLPSPGLLTADRTYYWHVRARDEKGVWGPWSATWSFTPRGPNHPLDLTVDANVLRWKPNPLGRKPAAYRVYGSDERGFSVSDVPLAVSVGVTKELTNPFPATFLGETKSPELALLNHPVRTYYRVVAVDDRGRRSGPSTFVEIGRPIVYSRPGPAKAGTPWRYAVLANRSLGDLKLRQVNGRDTAGFWDIERLGVTMDRGPEWLTVDPRTGVLSGTPPAAGSVEVQLTVTVDREIRKLDPDILAWGNEKVVSTSTERVGTATHGFTIVVDP